MNNTKVEQFAQLLDEQHEEIELGNAVKRLMANSDFKKVILNEYIINDAARKVAASTNFALSAEHRQDLLLAAQGAGYLKNFLNLSIMYGEKARQQIEETKLYHEEALADAAL